MMGFPAAPPSILPEELHRLKQDRLVLDIAIEEVGNLLHGAPTQITGDSCRCPFHHDENPSGSLHQVLDGTSVGTWLYTCHGCPEGGGEWNDLNNQKSSNSGDAVAVLRAASKRAGQEMGFQDACQWLLDAFQQRYGNQAAGVQSVATQPAQIGPDPGELTRIRTEMQKAQDRLHNDPGLLKTLWEQRAVSAEVATEFGIGFSDEEPGGDYWVFPIKNTAGELAAVKLHAAGDAQPKSWWYPKNAKPGDPLFPVSLDSAGPVWLCSGELKALAVLSLGLPAIGITSGERSDGVSQEAIDLLRGRQVALVADNDETGQSWANAAHRQLVAAGIDTRIVGLAFTKKGEDIGDWLVRRRVTEGQDTAFVRDQLLAAYEEAPVHIPTPPDVTTQPLAPSASNVAATVELHCPIRSIGEVWADEATWAPVERVRTHIGPLDDVLHGGFRTRAVHLIVGKAGHAKTQLACQIAVNAARGGIRVGFVSLEMDRADIARLVLAQLSEVPRTFIDRGIRSFHDRQAAKQAGRALAGFQGLPLDIVGGEDFVDGFTRTHLQQGVAKGVREHGWELVIVDHLGELAPLPNDSPNHPLQIDKANAAVLRAVARQHDVALVVVAPLRKVANFKDAKKNKLMLDDVMGSAAIGYAVHTCIAVTAKYKPHADSEVELSVLKNRNGRTPDEPLVLRWQANCGRISARDRHTTLTTCAAPRAPPAADRAQT